MKLVKQVYLDNNDGPLGISGFQVPGGWVYNSIDKSSGIMGSCFVPFPIGQGQDEIFTENAELRRLLQEAVEYVLFGPLHRDIEWVNKNKASFESLGIKYE